MVFNKGYLCVSVPDKPRTLPLLAQHDAATSMDGLRMTQDLPAQ